MINKNEVPAKIISIVAEQLGLEVARVLPEHTFGKDLGADSLDTVELMMAIEDATGLEIADDDAEHLTTVQSVIDHVLSRII